MKRIIVFLMLAAVLCGTVACKDATPDVSESKIQSVDTNSDASSSENTKTVYSYNDNNIVIQISFDEENRVVSYKSENLMGDMVSWKALSYANGFTVSEKTVDGKIAEIRYYNSDGSFKHIDVYTDEGIVRWSDSADGFAEQTSFDKDGNKTETKGYVGKSAYHADLETQKHVYSILYRKDGTAMLRNEFKDGVQQKSISYSTTGEISTTKEFVYENGKNIRVDQFDAQGKLTIQLLYGYTEKGSYAYTETKQNGITTEKTEYVYDEAGKQTAELVYKFDEAGNPTEYEKWTITDGNKTLEGVYAATGE